MAHDSSLQTVCMYFKYKFKNTHTLFRDSTRTRKKTPKTKVKNSELLFLQTILRNPHVFHNLKKVNSDIRSILPFLVELFHTFKRLNKLKNLIPLAIKNQLPSKRKDHSLNVTGQEHPFSK